MIVIAITAVDFKAKDTYRLVSATQEWFWAIDFRVEPGFRDVRMCDLFQETFAFE